MNRVRRPIHRCGQRGQSLVEMAIALIVLVPLAAGVMLLGQYIHIKQQTQSAARAAAWQATVSPDLALQKQLPDKAGLLDDLRARHFGESKAALVGGTRDVRVLDDPMLTTFAGQELLKPEGVELTDYSQETGTSILDKAMGGLDKILGPLGMGDRLPPNSQGLVTAVVHARPERIKDANGNPLAFLEPLDRRDLDFSAKTVLLADAWNAAGGGENRDGSPSDGASHRSVRNVVRPLVPSNWAGDSVIGVLNDVMKTLGNIPILDEVLTAGWDDIEFGKVAPDAVPADKLVKYAEPH